MGIINKLNSIMADVKIELNMSMPVCNRENEIVFFYSIKESDNKSYRIGKIYDVYVFDKNKNVIEKADIEKILPADVRARFENAVIHPSITGERAVDAKLEYLDEYENLAAVMYNEGADKKLIRKAKIFFDEYLSDKALAEIYHFLGKEMFDYMEKNV